MCEKLPKFDLNGEFNDRNYKSCFARSVAVNSQYKQTKSLDFRQPSLEQDSEVLGNSVLGVNRPVFATDSKEVVRLRKNSRVALEDGRRLSCGNIANYRRNRIAEIPVENIVNQSKIETLQWQLKEIEKSREMYRAVMKQVVTFLEKAHHSLEMLGSRLNRKNSISRSKSDFPPDTGSVGTSFVELDESWQKHKKPDVPPEEIPPEKLSQEAFRLLRTAQSLLSTREPSLTHIGPPPSTDPPNDLEFLAQLAKEFPRTPEPKPQRAPSFSLTPKLILPENDVKISTAFNRKLSLQLSDARRHSVGGGKLKPPPDSARFSVAESENELGALGMEYTPAKGKEKSGSPAAGSVSSVEDESGFSSMNSFQDVGLPLVNSTLVADEVCTKHALLRSMLHNNSACSSLNYSEHNSDCVPAKSAPEHRDTHRDDVNVRHNPADVRLWQKPAQLVQQQHKRWHSTPVEEKTEPSLKVLWV